MPRTIGSPRPVPLPTPLVVKTAPSHAGSVASSMPVPVSVTVTQVSSSLQSRFVGDGPLSLLRQPMSPPFWHGVLCVHRKVRSASSTGKDRHRLSEDLGGIAFRFERGTSEVCSSSVIPCTRSGTSRATSLRSGARECQHPLRQCSDTLCSLNRIVEQPRDLGIVFWKPVFAKAQDCLEWPSADC